MLDLVVTDGRLIEISATVLILVTREGGRLREISGTIGHRQVVIPTITGFRAETANLAGTLDEATKIEAKGNLVIQGA